MHRQGESSKNREFYFRTIESFFEELDGKSSGKRCKSIGMFFWLKIDFQKTILLMSSPPTNLLSGWVLLGRQHVIVEQPLPIDPLEHDQYTGNAKKHAQSKKTGMNRQCFKICWSESCELKEQTENGPTLCGLAVSDTIHLLPFTYPFPLKIFHDVRSTATGNVTRNDVVLVAVVKHVRSDSFVETRKHGSNSWNGRMILRHHVKELKKLCPFSLELRTCAKTNSAEYILVRNKVLVLVMNPKHTSKKEIGFATSDLLCLGPEMMDEHATFCVQGLHLVPVPGVLSGIEHLGLLIEVRQWWLFVGSKMIWNVNCPQAAARPLLWLLHLFLFCGW